MKLPVKSMTQKKSSGSPKISKNFFTLFFKKLFDPIKNNFHRCAVFLKKYIFIEKYKQLFLIVLGVALLGEVFFVDGSSDLRFFGLTILFFITTFMYRLSSRVTFTICLILLGIMYVQFLLSNASVHTEKIAVWIVLFMVVGVIQQWNE